MNNIKDFTDQYGRTLAHAAIPDDYQIGGALVDGFQHESVPFYITAHAINPKTNTMIFGLSDEKYTTYKNKMLKMTLNSMSDVRWDSIRDFVEPEVYLDTFAKALSQMKELTPIGEAALPSVCGQNQNQTYNDFMTLYNDSFQRDASFGTPSKANNILVKSFMRRYNGIAPSGAQCSVIAGMDYNGIEYYSTTSMLSVINPLAGLLGSAIKNQQASNSSTKLGEGTPCDAIDWGARNKFLMVCPKEYENEAFNDFMDFVETFHMDQTLRQRYYELISQRIQMRMQETMRFQSMAQQSMMNLQRSQQQLTQTLAANSRAMSDGIMDSWNRKMASDSRISQARSEATMGVNTYTTTYGQDVQVGVTADHVYQNQYGDVYGVSGNAPDQETLNDLNWTEIYKK
ncbi:MAG: hypothetical protein IKS51_09100 [Erysipelotrichaceae bacterium]|nr:hypothetical protein [Erysipelotrichaceae bacterium]